MNLENKKFYNTERNYKKNDNIFYTKIVTNCGNFGA